MSDDSNKYGLTGAEYERAVELCDDATRKPWEVKRLPGKPQAELAIELPVGERTLFQYFYDGNAGAAILDAEFIAQSRDLLPKALKTIAQLTNEISTLRTQAEAGKLLDQMSRSMEVTMKTMLKMAIERIEQNRADDAKEVLQKALKSLE